MLRRMPAFDLLAAYYTRIALEQISHSASPAPPRSMWPRLQRLADLTHETPADYQT